MKASAEAPATRDVKTITPGPVRGPKRGSTKRDPRAEPRKLEKYSLVLHVSAFSTARAMARPLKRKGMKRRR